VIKIQARDQSMLDAEFLAMVRCPENHTKLALVDSATVARLNDAVAAGRLKTRSGQLIDKRLDGALIREDRRVLYPIIDQIPILLIDEAIPSDEFLDR
jgi:uncharacterized protein YbaR (Trm112 family)